jgi:hypothetical protein
MGVTSWELGVLRVPLIMVPDKRCRVIGMGLCWSESTTIAWQSHLRVRFRSTTWAGITATGFTVSSTSRSSRYLAHYKLPSGSMFGCGWHACRRLRIEVGERLLAVRSGFVGRLEDVYPYDTSISDHWFSNGRARLDRNLPHLRSHPDRRSSIQRLVLHIIS